MGYSKVFRECRQKRMDMSGYQEERYRKAAIKEAEKEAKKTNPLEIRRTKASAIAQGINADKQEIYELLYSKLDARVDELYNLIIEDLGLDKDENLRLTPYNIYEIFSYYESRGLRQLKDASNSEMMEFNKTKTPPYSKLFKKLILKRAEFMIVAPKERLSLNAPFTKIKDEETQIELVKHMEELNLLPNYEFAKKYPKLNNLYNEIKEENLGV